jgi:hypothetical protein
VRVVATVLIVLGQAWAVQQGLIVTVCNNNPDLESGCLGDFELSLYFVLSTLTTVGYGDFSPKSRSLYFLVWNMPMFFLFSSVCEILLNMILYSLLVCFRVCGSCFRVCCCHSHVARVHNLERAIELE